MAMFNFLNKLKSHKTVENKFDRIIDKGFVDKDKTKYTTEFGEYYAKDGSIKIDGFMNEATNYLTSNIYELEHKQAIEKYRYMSTLPEVDDAITEVVNSAIVLTEDDQEIIEIDFKDNDLSDNLKSVILEEFEFIRDILLDFKDNGSKLFRQWYVDGSLHLEKVFDPTNIREGIKKVNILDSYYISYYTILGNAEIQTNSRVAGMDIWGREEIVDEFFVISKPNLGMNQASNTNPMFNAPKWNNSAENFRKIKVAPELITYIDSGLYHPNKYYPYSYLHKALKVSNQLTLLEDALLIYRITRAPERRIFFIEVGNMPPNKAEEYIRKLMRQYRQEKVYDANTGSIDEKSAFMAMTEDFWLPRRNGQSTTEVSTLQGGQNLSEIEDLNYFANKIWRALGVPFTRRQTQDNSGGVTFNSGRELTIEELKFHKFVTTLRREFSKLFEDLIATQLIVKRIVNSEEIDVVLSKIKYLFANDNYFSELLQLDILSNRLDVLNNLESYVGKYFDDIYVWKEILKFTDDDIIEMKERLRLYNEQSGDEMSNENDEGMSPPS